MRPSRPHVPGAGYVLLVDDNRELSTALSQYLEAQHYCVDFAADGLTAIRLVQENSYDAVLLDGMLPGMDGVAVCRRLRSVERLTTPILMLTGRTQLEDKIAALDAGADDYLCKPFELRELHGRLRALIRRERRQVVPDVLRLGDLTFDTGTLEVQRAGRPVAMAPIGLRILELLMRESPRVVTRTHIERAVWAEAMPDSDTLRSHLYLLRRAIDRDFSYPLIHTLPGFGYRMDDSHRSGAQASELPATVEATDVA